jgi:hypothetical protein
MISKKDDVDSLKCGSCRQELAANTSAPDKFKTVELAKKRQDDKQQIEDLKEAKICNCFHRELRPPLLREGEDRFGHVAQAMQL